MTTFSVVNASQLKDALSKAAGGDRIELSGGDYGDLLISKRTPAAEVTIAAKDPETPPRFSSVLVVDSKNLTFDGLDIKLTPTKDTVEWSSAFRVDGSSNIALVDSTVTGGDSVAGIDPNAPAGSQGSKGILGYPIGNGLMINWSSDIRIEGNDISNFTSGIRVGKVDGLEVRDNEISDVRKVPLGGGEVSNVVVADNHFHSIKPWKFGPDGDHGDHIHFYTSTKQAGPSSNITISGNFLAEGEGTSVLGIYLDDNANHKGFRNVVIEDNVIHNGDMQGMRMEDVVGLQIRSNTMLQSSGSLFDAPIIYLAEGTRDVVIDKNIISGIAGPALSNVTANGISILDNVTVQTHVPQAANYVGRLFVNAHTDNPTLADLTAKAGSMVAGYGAEATQQDGLAPHIVERHGDGLDLSSHDFAIVGSIGASLAKTAAPTKVVWDFGDGSAAAAGVELIHTYARPGTYVATATVTSGREVQVLQKVVEVASPIALEASFNGGIKDTSDAPHAAKTVGTVRLEPSAMGSSVRLVGDRATVGFKSAADMQNNDEFSVSLGYKKDAGAEGLGGRLFYFGSLGTLDVTGDGLSFRGSTSKGEPVMLSATKLGLRDQDWHQVTFTFSKEDGSAILYLDGREVDRVDGLKGSQPTLNGHDFQLGNPYGPNLKGLLDNLSFVRAALTPDQVEDHHSNFEKGAVTDFRSPPGTKVVTPNEEPTPERGGMFDESWHGFVLDVTDPAMAKFLRGATATPTADGVKVRFDGDGDCIHIGRRSEYEASDQIGFSVNFSREEGATGTERLVWNHGKLGLTLKDGGLVMEVRGADGKLKAFNFRDLGLDDIDSHNVTVMLDDRADRLQVVVDDRVILDKRGIDFEVNSGQEWGWMLGTPWDRHFNGDITDFRLGDRFAFVEEHLTAGLSVG